jgi:hypothetical protein
VVYVSTLQETQTTYRPAQLEESRNYNNVSPCKVKILKNKNQQALNSKRMLTNYIPFL